MTGAIPSPRRVHVNLDGGRDYDIHIGPGLIDRMAGLMPFSMAGRSAFIVTDKTVGPLYAHRLVSSLNEAGARRADMLALPPGESTKNFTMLENVTDWILSTGGDRSSVVFALGGGVIGDLAGFAAAITMRGLAYVQIPTTLLAQVDSAVGGKTAIDTRAGKNLVGAFHQPVCVIADTETLETLPVRERLAGYAEVVKYGLLGDRDFFERLDGRAPDLHAKALDAMVLSEIIARSVQAKADIVCRDEREEGIRALLNLGHTFGHALELAVGMNDSLLHGEAVSIGMVLAFDLSVRLGLCPEDHAARVRAHLAGVGLPVSIAQIRPALSITPEALIEMMRGDKKSVGGQITFVLVRGIGQAFVEKKAPLDVVALTISDSMKA